MTAPFAGAAAADPSSSCAALPTPHLRVLQHPIELFSSSSEELTGAMLLWSSRLGMADSTQAEQRSAAAQGWHPALMHLLQPQKGTFLPRKLPLTSS